MTARVRVYVAFVGLLAAALVGFLGTHYPVTLWTPLVALIVLNVVTENFSFQLPLSGSVSLSFAITYAALIYAGPLGGVLCAVAGSTTLEEFRTHKPLQIRLFNASQLALSAGLAGLAYLGLGGRLLSAHADLSAPPILAASAAAGVFFLINVSLVGYLLALRSERPIAAVFREQGFLSYAASLVVLGLLGFTVAALLAERSLLGLLLLVLPFMAARRTFRVYAELNEAFNSTVSSLVTAIEAKDPYTRGHSERVAEYAGSLARHVGLSRREVELLERAALLHDVGKIAVDIETLSSPSQLSSEEVRLIRQHPLLGSRLVADVEFLSDIAPIIRHHHERFDGAGYPDALAGAKIPLLARVLAVADAYDAMTSDRAYRLGMSTGKAIAEIVRVAGTQLDPQIARQFAEMMTVRTDSTGAA